MVALPAESNGWNPVFNQWTESGAFPASSMFDALAIYENDGRIQPWLAESWKPNEDFTQWDITLRGGVYFHDGTVLDAAAAKRNLDAYYRTGATSIGLKDLYDHVEVVSAQTVRAYLKVRWAQFPTSFILTWMMAPSMLDRSDAGVKDPVGTGPFVFGHWDEGRSLIVNRFPRYWRKSATGQALPYLDRIEFRVIEDTASRQQSLHLGQVDLALMDSRPVGNDLRTTHAVIDDRASQRTFIMLNTAVGPSNRGNPFGNLHARRALAYGTDRRRIVASIGPGAETTDFGFYLGGSPWKPVGGDGYVDYDPVSARKEIEAYKRESGQPALRFQINGRQTQQDMATLTQLRDQWAELGIEARIEAQDPSRVILLAAIGHYDATWLSFSAFPDPDLTFFYYASSTSRPIGDVSLNFTRWTTPGLDHDLKVIRESTNQADRKAASDALIREANSQPTAIWLYDTPFALVADQSLGGLDGFRSHAFGNHMPKPWLADVFVR